MAPTAQRRLAAMLTIVATMTVALAGPVLSVGVQADVELREFKLTPESERTLTQLWMSS